MYSGLHQCRQTFLTKLQLMRWKTPLMVISYQIYMEHVFLKLSTFGFGYNSHWIFPHINTFAYLNKGERCMTFSDVRCYKTGPFLFTELWCKDENFPPMLWYLISTALTQCIDAECFKTENTQSFRLEKIQRPTTMTWCLQIVLCLL